MSKVYLLALLTIALSFLMIGCSVAPMDLQSGTIALSDRSNIRLDEPEVGKRNPVSPNTPVKIVKHVKQVCDSPICKHAQFLD